jgi:hypothetical protein
LVAEEDSRSCKAVGSTIANDKSLEQQDVSCSL